MSTRARIALVALAGAQLLFPLGMIGWNELQLALGTEVRLKTAPVDPVDLFRGRYVALRYEISSLPVDGDVRRGDTVYVVLERSAEIWTGGSASTSRPEDGTFIRGRVTSGDRSRASIEYGIETYFVDEDEAPELERSSGRLVVDVVLDDDGRARIDGVRPRRG